MNEGRFIGHLDADCFYVSAERVRDQYLMGLACGVLGNQGACVIAKSYEMKACGVKTGEPIWEAQVKCPDGIYLKRDFRWYEVLSRQMLALAREFSPSVEFYSIDEFFFDACPPPGMNHQAYAEMIRDRIMDAVGVPVTVGIATTKTVAKLISDSAKPFGAKAVLDSEATTAMLASLPVTEISGIAGRRAARLEPHGITTCLDLARADRGLIRELLTASGEALWWELNGDAVTPIHIERPAHKALARGGSFGETTRDPMVLFAWLVRNLERLIEELEFHKVLAGRLTVWVGYKDKGGRSGSGRVNLTLPTDRFDELLDYARPCLHSAWIPKAPAWRMHLIAEHLIPRNQAQLGLFEEPNERAAVLAKLKRTINEKMGRFAVRSGSTLPLAAIYADEANNYDICDVRGKICF
jgi:DNA polymerase V